MFDKSLKPRKRFLMRVLSINDRAVFAAYGLKPDTPEPEIVAHLFKLYAEKIEMNK